MARFWNCLYPRKLSEILLDDCIFTECLANHCGAFLWWISGSTSEPSAGEHNTQAPPSCGTGAENKRQRTAKILDHIQWQPVCACRGSRSIKLYNVFIESLGDVFQLSCDLLLVFLLVFKH